MSAFGKLIAGAAITGAAAYGVYSFLQKYRVTIEPINQDGEKEAASEEDFAEDAADAAETEAEESAESGKAFDPAKVFDREKAAEAADTIRNAANRAYTTIQHGSQQAVDKVKEAVGPKGADVIDAARSAAAGVGQTVIDSASKIRDIIASGREEADVVDAGEVKITPETAPESDKAEEKAEEVVEKAADAAEAVQDKAEAAPADSEASAAEEPAETKGSETTVEFFDDEV